MPRAYPTHNSFLVSRRITIGESYSISVGKKTQTRYANAPGYEVLSAVDGTNKYAFFGFSRSAEYAHIRFIEDHLDRAAVARGNK